VRGLTKHFPLKKGGLVRAVDGVDFEVLKGETLGVVGESGCGKSTTARLLMQLMAPTAGELIFDGRVVGSRDLPLKEFRRQVQMVFQDSYASLNPRLTIEDSIAFGRGAWRLAARGLARARDLLARVGLAPERFAERYPHELSGGQRQRVNIARALALQPRLVILDEAVSALDKSVEAQVLNLLLDLKREFGLTYVFISHDLNVVHYISDRVMVMYLGQVAEIGPSDTLFASPATLHRRAAVVHAVDGPGPPHREGPAGRRPAQPDQPAHGLPLPPRCPQAAPSAPARPGAHRTGRPPCGGLPDARGRQRPPRRPGHLPQAA
jgi:peptide/nickel transport system ATP-binding protein